jgi:two-component system, NtrC family, sensor histidine kinase HydH
LNYLPNWKNNLIVFVLLTLLVVSYFFYEQQSVKQSYQEHSREHSEILAAVVELNIRNAYLTRDTIETILAGSMANSGRFVSYLNDIDPFSVGELAAFAREAGLAGIGIRDLNRDQLVSGPQGWLSPEQVRHTENEGLTFLSERQLYLYTLRTSSFSIIVGLDTGKIEKMLDDVSVERLLGLLSNLAAIAYVRVVTREGLDPST